MKKTAKKRCGLLCVEAHCVRAKGHPGNCSATRNTVQADHNALLVRSLAKQVRALHREHARVAAAQASRIRELEDQVARRTFTVVDLPTAPLAAGHVSEPGPGKTANFWPAGFPPPVAELREPLPSGLPEGRLVAWEAGHPPTHYCLSPHCIPCRQPSKEGGKP